MENVRKSKRKGEARRGTSPTILAQFNFVHKFSSIFGLLLAHEALVKMIWKKMQNMAYCNLVPGTDGEPPWAQLSKLKRNKLERSPDENQSGNVVRRKKTFLEDLSMNVDMEDDGIDVEEDNQGGPPLEAVSLSEAGSSDIAFHKGLTCP